MSRSLPLPRLRAQAFQRYASGGDEMLVAEIELHTASGGVAILRGWGGPTCTVVKNDILWMVRLVPLDEIKGPIGSYPSVALALAASDAWATRSVPEMEDRP